MQESEVISAQEIPINVVSDVEARAGTYFLRLPPDVRGNIGKADFVGEARLIARTIWKAIPGGIDGQALWRHVEAAVAARFEIFAEQSIVRSAVVEQDWRAGNVVGTELFLVSHLVDTPSIRMDTEFARDFYLAAMQLISHVSASAAIGDSTKCSCVEGAHHSVRQAATRWSHTYQRTETRLNAMIDCLLHASPAFTQDVLSHATGRLGASGSSADCCSAMWFGIFRHRENQRARRERGAEPNATTETGGSVPPTLDGGQTALGARVRRREVDGIEIGVIMDVAHRLMVGLPVVDGGRQIVTLSDDMSVIVSPSAPTRVLVPRVLRCIYLAVVDGRDTPTAVGTRPFHKLALASAATVIRPDPIPSADERRNRVDKQVSRIAAKSLFVLCQAAEHAWPANAVDFLWTQFEPSANRQRLEIERQMEEFFNRPGLPKVGPT